jgi:hypothetical protein
MNSRVSGIREGDPDVLEGRLAVVLGRRRRGQQVPVIWGSTYGDGYFNGKEKLLRFLAGNVT